MTQLKTISNKEFLKELKARVAEEKISEEEVFATLNFPFKPEIITEYKKVDYSKLTAEDWKKAYQDLEKDKNYQMEVQLWDSIDDDE
ncbi:MAG: hypothetical protein I3273_07245 [Candidatus Moeniiplasma glomeromycotorum]|nr:hypothetical protein [Candidatus Moeniiplasma glomeromycotorum]MCE8168321.1 hypothetical protein [Candidatus Moeniiplasma glomeromycotorum]MCE8169881.1 hypothetical protein [Candidatus Moeniiplasma glomeromycotorum]